MLTTLESRGIFCPVCYVSTADHRDGKGLRYWPGGCGGYREHDAFQAVPMGTFRKDGSAYGVQVRYRVPFIPPTPPARIEGTIRV